MRDDVQKLGKKRREPTDREITAARDLVGQHAFRWITAKVSGKRAPRVDRAKLAAAEQLLTAAGEGTDEGAKERFEAKLTRITEAQQASKVLRQDLEAKRQALQKQREEAPPRPLKLVKGDDTESEQPRRQERAAGKLFPPGGIVDSPRRSFFAALRWRVSGH